MSLHIAFRERIAELTRNHGNVASLLTFMREYIPEFTYEKTIPNTDYHLKETLKEKENAMNQTDDVQSHVHCLLGGDKRRHDGESHQQIKHNQAAHEEETVLYKRDSDVADILSHFNMPAEDWLKLPFAAIEKTRMDILEMCIHSGVDLNIFKSPSDYNLLMYAFNLPNVNNEIISILMKYSNKRYITNNGQTAVTICIKNDALNAEQKLYYVKLLAEGGYIMSSLEDYKLLAWESALHSYISSLLTITSQNQMKYWKEFIDTFLSAGLDINDKDWLGETPLMIATMGMTIDEDDETEDNELVGLRQEKISLIQYLLEKGANPNCPDNCGRTCAHILARLWHFDLLKLLFKNGCNPNAQCEMKMTCVYWLCSDAYIVDFFIPMIKMLVAAGCSINAQATDQSIALHFTAAKCNHTVCEQLILLGSNVNAEDYLKRTPLHMAARNNNSKVIETLIRFGGDVNVRDIHNDTPLHIACIYDNVEVAKILIRSGVNPQAVGDLGIQPIHLAAENGSLQLIYLLAPLVSLDAIDIWNATPLHYAASDGNIEIVKHLLNIGVDKTAVDSHGLTPYNMATYRGFLKVAELLLLDEDDVKFGDLPCGVFPNKPLIAFDEMDTYFNNLTKLFLDHGKYGKEFAKFILGTHGLGEVNIQQNDAKIITEKMTDIAHQIADRIGEIEPLFRCRLLKAGSMAEESKAGYPDEYDFLCCVDGFSRFIERIDPNEGSEFAKIIMKESTPVGILDSCVSKTRILNATTFFRQFTKIASSAFYDVLNRGFSQIYSGNTLLPDLVGFFFAVLCYDAKIIVF